MVKVGGAQHVDQLAQRRAGVQRPRVVGHDVGKFVSQHVGGHPACPGPLAPPRNKREDLPVAEVYDKTSHRVLVEEAEAVGAGA